MLLRCGYLVLAAGLLAGCKGVSTQGERQAHRDLQTLTAAYRPPVITNAPALETGVTLEALMRYAMLHQPRVAAAYYDYAAAVHRITQERSLPDPRLTLELDIQDVVMVVMPGLMAEFPFYQKLRVGAHMATAESEARYFAFERAVLETAYEVKRAYFRLHFLEERLAIVRENAQLSESLEEIARARTEAGKATLQDVLRAQIDQERLKTEVENLEDSRSALMARLRGALGLATEAPDPAVPRDFSPTPTSLGREDLFAVAVVRNPRLKQMEAEVRLAEAGIQLARLSRYPDFNIGVEADVKASPVMWRPSMGVTLPIWRDKIAAEMAGAQARRRASAERLSAEQIDLAIEYADRSVAYREATRNLELVSGRLLPKARQALEVSRNAYVSAVSSFTELLDAQRTLLELRLSEVDSLAEREMALAELSLLIAGVPPAGAPILAREGSARDENR